MSIEVRGLVKMYGAQKAVDTISFTVNRGEIVGFLGPNGAGKSTTMKMITGYLEPDAGTVNVSGIDVLKQPLEAKRKLGYLPESNALYYDMYIREYLHFIADVHRVKGKKDAVENVILLTGLTPESRKKIGQLSKGYKQRVGLAASLIHSPEVLILDEPTSGLDPNQIIEIRNVIRQQGRDKSVLFSSHILQEVEAICDRVIIINRGKLVADDALKNLQNRNAGTQVVQVQFTESIATSLLQGLPGVLAIQQPEPFVYMLETPNADALRRKLLSFAVEHNLNIVALQTGSQSLEEIFRSLTTGNN